MKSLIKFRYMVEFSIPENPPSEFFTLIPGQRLAISHLFDQNIVLMYSLNQSRTKLWAILLATSPEEVEKIINQLPLSKFMTWEIDELLFYETSDKIIPFFSLN